jgi:threonine/homoserine/homoserine lactone efflux protein
MSLITFLLSAFVISLSGVMMPGPVTAVTIGKGTSSPHAGAWMAVGHGIVEYPLMILIFYGLGTVFKIPPVKTALLVFGGLLLLWMGLDMLRKISRIDVDTKTDRRSPLVVGVLLSLSNPYFILWWVTIGAALVTSSLAFGTGGFLAFTVVHWLCDFGWLYFLSALSFKGGQFFGGKFQKAVFALCGGLLIFFAVKFFYDGVGSMVR